MTNEKLSNGTIIQELEELAGGWSEEAAEAQKNGNVAYSVGMSACADELRAVVETYRGGDGA